MQQYFVCWDVAVVSGYIITMGNDILLYIMLFVLGKGRFGRVLLAKAEGIVRDSPGRNIVAVKECQGKENQPLFVDRLAEFKDG